MTDKTLKNIDRTIKIAFHRLAIGLYEGSEFSRGETLREEVLEYFRLLAKSNNAWRNILKTKEQKEHAIYWMTTYISNEFGASVVDDYKAPEYR